MLGFLFTLFLGWPAILACVVVTIIGLFRKDHRFLTLAGIIAIPFSWYVSGFPQVRSLMFLSPMLLFIAAWLMFHKLETVAWLFAVPFLLLILLFISVVLATPA
jgi:hypothetical protein